MPALPGDPRVLDELRRAAFLAAAAGYYVFPVRPRRKTPAIEDWEHAATQDAVQIGRWWRLPYNIGIATGRSGLVVVDLDHGHGQPAPEAFRGARDGLDVLTRLAAAAGAPVPTDTFTVLTPTGGRHLYVRAPPGSSYATPRAGWAGGSTPAPTEGSSSPPGRSGPTAATRWPSPHYRCGSCPPGCGRP